MTPEELQFGKEILAQVSIISLAAIAAWKFAKRQEKKVPLYTGLPDDQPRKITRKEWHELSDPVQAHINKFYVLEKEILPRITKDIDQLQRVMNQHLSESSAALSTFVRMDERLSQHIKQWDEGVERAVRERSEMMQRIENIDEKLDRLDRRRD